MSAFLIRIATFIFAGMGCIGVMGFLSTPPFDQEFRELHRPQFHFSPDSMWMNDPNGMVYFDGEYHLFYQYHPHSIVWGPMHWGHAVSSDLVHWEHLPVALFPDSLGYIFSGSTVIDYENTSGLGSEDKPPMVAIFTHHDPQAQAMGSHTFQSQSLAFSLDKGRTWSKYPRNPVLANPGILDFRDPKVFWHDESRRWIMVCAAWDHIRIYSSPDLINWEYKSDFGQEWGAHGGVWECPDLFPLSAENGEKWMMLVSIGSGGPNGGSATQYFLGEFDGTEFKLDPDFQKRLGTTPASLPAGTLLTGFEEGYDTWEVHGNAFGAEPAQGTLDQQNSVSSFEGRRLVNSFLGGDDATGRLISPSVTVESDFLNFLVGGGSHSGTSVRCLYQDSVIYTVSGKDSEELSWTSWKLTDYLGEEVVIEIVDSVTEGWGHILADHFMFAEEAAVPESEKAVWLDYGKDNYAGVTWSDIPSHDGRRIFIGWMSNWQYATSLPTTPWRNAMTLPRTIELVEMQQGAVARTVPVVETQQLRTTTRDLRDLEVSAQSPQWIELTSSGTIELKMSVDLLSSSSDSFGIKFGNADSNLLTLGFDREANEWFLDRSQSGITSFSDQFSGQHRAPHEFGEYLTVHVFLDWSSIEVFVDDGLSVMTEIFFSETPLTQVSLWTDNERILIPELQIHTLSGIWNSRQ